MSCSLYRIVNGRREYIGSDRHDRNQFTGDLPSRRRFEASSLAERKGADVYFDHIGELFREDEDTGETKVARIVWAPFNEPERGPRQ